MASFPQPDIGPFGITCAPRDYYDLVSGRRRGVGPATLRAGLAACEIPYRWGVWWRNRRYDTRAELVHGVDAPVISVGNLTLGGVGKTPMVKWIARRLRERGVRVALVSRGYGADDRGVNDEALELEHSLPDVPHVQDRDRVAAARVAIEELAAQAVVLDDGFQHRRIARDLDVVLLDATEPFGFGRVFPRGALREPVESLRRAAVVCLTRRDLIDEAAREAIRRRVEQAAPEAVWCESRTAPSALIGVDPAGGELTVRESLAEARGARTLAFCGLGNPSGFAATVDGLGVDLDGFLEFPDHHRYTRDDVQRVASEARARGVDLLLCTLKDLVKVRVADLEGIRLRAVGIETEFAVGEPEFAARIDGVAGKALTYDPLANEPEPSNPADGDPRAGKEE